MRPGDVRHLRCHPDPRRAAARRAGRDVLDRDDRRDDASRAERPRHLRRRPASRSASAGSASSTSRAATSRSRTRTARSGRSRTASSTTTTRSATTSPARPPLREPLRHRDPPAPLRGASAPRSRSSCGAMFGIAVWDGERAARRRRARPARDQAALLRRSAATSSSSPPSSRACSRAASSTTELDYEAIDAYLTLGFFPAPATPLAAVRKLEPGASLVVDGRRRRAAAYWSYPQPTREPRRDAGSGARAAAGRSSRSPCGSA